MLKMIQGEAAAAGRADPGLGVLDGGDGLLGHGAGLRLLLLLVHGSEHRLLLRVELQGGLKQYSILKIHFNSSCLPPKFRCPNCFY